jgi:trehalose 6-phosphate synthase/phosphatase
MNTVPLNKASAPIPVSAHATPVQPHEASELHIPAQDREQLKKKLEEDHGGHVELVWLADDTDEDGTITLRNQHRWRKYGEHELFTLFHYKQNEPSDGRAMKKNWHCYEKMNRVLRMQSSLPTNPEMSCSFTTTS